MTLGKIAPFIIIIAIIAFFTYSKYRASEQAKANRVAGAEFLAQNKSADGVVETSSGLQYVIMQQGAGGAKPKSNDSVTVHYHGTLLDGTVFDSSVERGASIGFPLNRVIKGWTEGLQLMSVGDKYRFFIPADLAYGDQSAGKIEPGSTLIFEVELLKIN
ncbi:MAG: FKBP-type peptidyl-prolyl cis-trans isomerase [Kangiellaceae bacterium]|jgi:peptidylprolyl isomerase|nr:FKBP-type peptidyl-prolyl cis-trans isomerase [Kangiellaceae bacterium]